jgi:DNA polymerase I
VTARKRRGAAARARCCSSARAAQHTRYDARAVRDRFGVEPRALPSLTALVGDSSDNLPSVPGVGPRTAARLLERFGDVNQLLEQLDDVTPERLKKSLAAHRDQILQTADLARLRDDVPLPPGPRWAPVSAAALGRLRALFSELEFASLLPRIDALIAVSP